MCTSIKSLGGFVFPAVLICLGSFVPLMATATVDASAGGVNGLPVQHDVSGRVQTFTEYASGARVSRANGFTGANTGAAWVEARDNPARVAGPFWATAGDDMEASWLGVSTRYVDSAGLYLEGVNGGEDSPWPGRTDSPFELNDRHAHTGQDAGEYATASGVKSQLNANLGLNHDGLNRSTREGWAINGNVVGTLPEPGTLLLMGLGLLGLGLARRRAAKSAY